MFSIIKMFYHRTFTSEELLSVIVNEALSNSIGDVSKFIVDVIDDGEEARDDYKWN